MKPEPRPFIGTERLNSLNESPKNLLKNGSSSNGKGDTDLLAAFSTSILTTAGEACFTIGTTGFTALMFSGESANELPAQTTINASANVNAKNFLVMSLYLQSNFTAMYFNREL